MSNNLRNIEDELYNLLKPQLREIVELMRDPKNNEYVVELPDPDTIDAPLEELASLVARTSNAYGRIARLAGMAKAEHKLAKGRYERKFKKSRVGANEAERDKNGMEACEEEHISMTVAEAISNAADDMEQAARVASESARKMYDKVNSMNFAQRREDHGTFRDNDFQPY